MGQVGRWNGHKFEVSPSKIYSFSDLTIKGEMEAKDVKKSKAGYVSRKSGKPTEVSLTVKLNAYTGCDVRAEALKFVTEARAGKKDYFYVGSKKLVTCKLILTSATVSNPVISASGKWVSADVKMTMKQCGKGDGDGSNGDGGSGGGGGGGGGGNGGGGGGNGGGGGTGRGGGNGTKGSKKYSTKTSGTTGNKKVHGVGRDVVAGQKKVHGVGRKVTSDYKKKTVKTATSVINSYKQKPKTFSQRVAELKAKA
jgi:hypothetical protein